MAQTINPQQTPFPVAEKWDDTGKELLRAGNRQSVPDPNVPVIQSREDLDRFMALLNYNLQHRIKQRKGKGKKGKSSLQGLFGGNR